MPAPPPPKEHQFKKGQSGNPGGISSEAALMIRENAEAALAIRKRLLSAVNATLNESATEDAVKFVEAAVLKLLKDAEDRGLGAPVQETNGQMHISIAKDDAAL